MLDSIEKQRQTLGEHMFRQFLLLISLIGFVHMVVAAERPNTLNFKLGSVKLTETSQTIKGLNVTFTEKSDAAVGVEYRIFTSDLIAFGVDAISYKHTYQTAGLTGDMRTSVVLGNAEMRWDAAPWFKPFLSLGAGIVTTSFSGGPLSGNTGGVAVGFRGGADIPLSDNMGLEFELRSITAKPEDSNNVKIDVSSRAVFIGLGLYF